MAISGRAWRRLATAVAVPGAAIGMLAGVGAPAIASTAQPHVVYSDETFHGFTRGINPNIPIYADGLVSDHGYLHLTGSNPGYLIQLSRGSLYVGYFNESFSEHVAQQSCNATISVTASYNIDGGTGHYYYASGSGTAHVKITAVLNRNHNGTCNTGSPIPTTVYTTFSASGSFYPNGL